MSEYEQRPDTLIAEARKRLTVSRLGSSYARETDKDLIVIRDLADALEARTGVAELEAENARLTAELASEREYTVERRKLDLYAVLLVDALGGLDDCDRVVAEGKRAVQAEALEAAANRVEDECAHHTGECYCTSSGWLRQRADAIREGRA